MAVNRSRTARRPPALRIKRPDTTPARADHDEATVTPGSAPLRVLRLIGSIIAPTTLVTALLWYFGHSHAVVLLNYLGVEESMLSYSAQYYPVRSVDALFRPVVIAAGLSLVALWIHGIVRWRVSDEAWHLLVKRLVPLAVIIGTAQLAVAGHGALRFGSYRTHPYVPGLCLAAGTVLLDAGLRALPQLGDDPRRTLFGSSAPLRITALAATFRADERRPLLVDPDVRRHCRDGSSTRHRGQSGDLAGHRRVQRQAARSRRTRPV